MYHVSSSISLIIAKFGLSPSSSLQPTKPNSSLINSKAKYIPVFLFITTAETQLNFTTLFLLLGLDFQSITMYSIFSIIYIYLLKKNSL